MWMDQRCQVCGSSPEVIHRHHIIPLKEGGPDILENIVFLCPKCHRKAEAGEISVSSLLNLAKERLTFEELIFSEELDKPFEAHIRLTLNHWADSEAKIHELCAFQGEDFLFCLYPPSIHGSRFYPQAMIGLWLVGEISSSELQEKIALSRVQTSPGSPGVK